MRAPPLSSLLRHLLPRRCPGCARPLGAEVGLCSSCFSNLRAQLTDASSLREVRVPHLIFLGEHEGPLRRTVAALKFGGARDLAARVAPPLAARIPAWWRIKGVCAVPLHPTRERQRGYNQSELLAREVARCAGVPHWRALERLRATKQQARLHGLERARNVEGAFRARSSVSGNVLLIDDVFTTGSTLKACERALLEAGAAEVFYLVLARG